MKPVFRCSSLDRLLTCPGSRTLEALLGPKQEDSGHAVQWAGSWCHYQAALRLRDEFGAVGSPDPLTIPASFVPSSYDEWVVDWYVRRVTSLIPSSWGMFVEQDWSIEFDRFILSGHPDFYAVSPDVTQIVIDDLKRGYDIVDAAEFNWQVAGYATLAVNKIPTLKQGLLRIHQPAAPDRTTQAAMMDIGAVAAMLEQKINQALDNPYLFVTGKGCKYCPPAIAKIKQDLVSDRYLICPTLKKDLITMQETLTKEFIATLGEFSELADVGELASHLRKLNYPSQRVVDLFKEALEANGGVCELKDGTIAKIIEEDGPRMITDVQFAHTQLMAKVGAPWAWAALKMPIGGIEQALADSGMQKTSKKKDVETAKTWIDANLAGVITRKPQKTLVFV